MGTLTVPLEGRRAFVQSFWLTLSVLAAAPWLAAGWWLRAPGLAAAGLALAVVVALPAALRREIAWRGYHAWNHRIVAPFRSTATRILLRICFSLVIVAVGRSGRSGAMRANVRPSWETRTPLPLDAYDTPTYLRWAWRTGNLWSVSMLPFLAVLRRLPSEDARAAQANIYTLF